MITEVELSELHKLSTARVRRNYWLCDAQLKMAEGKPHLIQTAQKLMEWQASYLDELVRRNERI